MRIKKIYFYTPDKLKLCGILTLPKNKTNKCVILCHGIAYDKDESGIFTHLADDLTRYDLATFRFDFRGHGKSEGDSVNTTIAGEEKDLESAIKFLINKDFKTFGIVAASFGGGVASFYISKNQNLIKALCLWNPLIDYASIINGTTKWTGKYFGKQTLEKVKKFGFIEIGSRKFKIGENLIHEIWKFKPWKELLKVSIPILFVHGNKDTYVPYQDSVKYSKLVKAGKLVTIKDAEHGFHDRKKDSEQANKATIDFFRKNL